MIADQIVVGPAVFFEEPQQSRSAKNLKHVDLPGPVLHYIVRIVIEVVTQNLPSHLQKYYIFVFLSGVSANLH